MFSKSYVLNAFFFTCFFPLFSLYVCMLLFVAVVVAVVAIVIIAVMFFTLPIFYTGCI